MNSRVVAILGMVLAVSCAAVRAGFTTGSRDAGFVLDGGGLTLSNNLALTDGALRFTQTDDAYSGTVQAKRSRIQVDDGSNHVEMYLTGKYNTNTGAITLDTNNDILRLDSGQTLTTATAVTCSAASTTIEGTGRFGGKISVDSAKDLNLKMQTPLNVAISNSGTLILQDDLHFMDGKGFDTYGGTISFNNYQMILGGDELTWVTNTQTWHDPSVVINADLNLDKDTNIAIASSGTVEGNGNRIVFEYGSSKSGHFTLADSTSLTIANATLNNLSEKSLVMGSGSSLYLSDVLLEDKAGKGTIHVANLAQVTPTDGRFFASPVSWDSRAKVEVIDDITLATTWTIDNDMILSGNGRMINMSAGSFATDNADGDDYFLSDVILSELVEGSFATDGMVFYLSNVTMIDNASADAIRVVGSTEPDVQAPAKMVPATGGNIFDSQVTWSDGAKIELLSNVAFGASGHWVFSDASNVDGNGNLFDVSASTGTAITIPTKKSLKLSNMVLKGWGTDANPDTDGEIVYSGGQGTLELSNVTVILNGDVTLGVNEKVVINGPVTFVTGKYTFDASASGTSNQVNGVTVWFDTLGEPSTNNVNLGDFAGGGRISAQQSAPFSTLSFADAIEYLSQSESLYYATDSTVDGSEIAGRHVIFDTYTRGGEIILDGEGRAFILGQKPASATDNYNLFEFTSNSTNDSNDSNAHFKNILIDGFQQEAFASGDGSANGDLTWYKFGNKTTLRLQEDEVLTSTIEAAFTANDQTMVIDLNGHTIDMSSTSGKVVITGDYNSTVIIKNGRITGVSGFDTTFSGPSSPTNAPTFRFQDVHMVLSANTRFANAKFSFKGNCTISGGSSSTGYELSNSSAKDMLVMAGSMLTLENGVTYKVASSHTIDLADSAATLSLVGATLDYSASTGQSLTVGSLRVDYKSTLKGPVTLGGAGAAALDIDFMPGATIDVESGVVTYGNAS